MIKNIFRVQADAIHGIQAVGDFEHDVVPYDLFCKILKDMDHDADPVCCEMTAEQALTLHSEYGISGQCTYPPERLGGLYLS